MDPRLERTRKVVGAVVAEFRAENLTFMAGSIAYHAFVSLLPLVVLLLVVLNSVGDRDLAQLVFSVVKAALTPEGGGIVSDAVGAGGRASGVSVLGVAVLVWATLRIFRGLDQAFSDIYETEAANTLVDQVADGVLVLVVVVAAVVGAAAVRSGLTLTGPAGTALETGFVVVALTAAFLPMYYVFPDTDLRVVEVLPGTVLAAVGVTALESAFRLYVQFSSTADYGVLGGILVLVTWLYFNGLVILLGAVVNAVLTNRTEDVDVAPVIGSYRPATDGDGGAHGDLPARLEGVRDGVGDGLPLSVLVGEERTDLPTPKAVTVEEDGDGVRIEVRW